MAQKKKINWVKWIIGLAILAIVGHFTFLGKHNLYQFYRLKQKEKALRAEIEAGEREMQRLFVEIDKLKSDSSYIEKIAREEYKMGKDGERIFIVKEKKAK